MLCENILKVGICFYDNMSKFINGLKNFQVIPRELIFDNSLSDRARFVYCFMASKPDGWDFLLNPMANELGYSVETLRKYINELIEGGWLKKGEQNNNDGMFGAVVYTLLSTKNTDTEKTRHEEIPTRENTNTENFRHGENPIQYNKDNEENKESIDKKDLPKKEEKDKSFSKKDANDDANNDVNEFVDRMYALYPAKCPKRGTYLGKSQKDKVKIKSLLKTYSESDIEFVIRWEVEQKYGKSYMLNFSTFLNNFPDPTQIDSYNELKGISTKPLPKGWEQERYDMYIRNGYTITEDGRLFKDGKEYK